MNLEPEDHLPDVEAHGLRRSLARLPLLLTLALACATQQTVVVWEKPGATAEELEVAREACLAEVDALQTRGVNRTRVEADATGACFVACMKRHGFTWRTEKVSPDEAATDAPERTPAQEPFDSPVPPPPPECSVGPSAGRAGT